MCLCTRRLEAVDSAEELAAAVNDPAAFFAKLGEAAGPAAKKLLIAKLRPKAGPYLKRHGLDWADVVPALEA